MVHGSAAEVEKARGIVERTQPIRVNLHSTEAVGAAVR